MSIADRYVRNLREQERYAALGRACESNGLGWYEGDEMRFQPPADLIAEQATLLARTETPEPAPSAEGVERAARIIDPGAWSGEGDLTWVARQPRRDKSLKTAAAVLAALPAPSVTQAETVGEPVAVGYRYLYPHHDGRPVWRFETGGREINGSRPLRSEPVFASPADARRCSSSGPEPGPGEGWPPTNLPMPPIYAPVPEYGSGSTAAPPSPGPGTGVEITEEMVERAARAVGRELKDQELSGAFDDLGEEGSDAAIARTALTAALQPQTSSKEEV